MAYDPKQLQVLAYAKLFTLWHYRTEDSREEVGGADYFHEDRDMLRHGDVVIVGYANGCVSLFSVVHVGDSIIMATVR